MRSRNRLQVGTSSLGPQPKAAAQTSTISYLREREQDLGSEKEQIQEVIHKLRTSYSFVSAEHEVRYLYFHPCLLLISLAFAVLDCCTWPQPPVGEK